MNLSVNLRSLAACALAVGCSSSDAAIKPVEPIGTCGAIVSDDDCDSSLRPIVFVHGTFGSGDNIGHVAQLFGSNGYCQKRFVAIEYNSLGSSPVQPLDALIDKVLADTGQTQVDLVGHSQGTQHCTSYLGQAARAAKVAHYVNLSGESMVPNDVPTLSISSDNDLGSAPHHAPNAEKTVTYQDEDHVDLAQSTRTFVEMYKYLIGGEPQYDEIQCGDEEVTIEGIAESFGDNTPIVAGKIEVFELGEAAQKRGEPVFTLTADANGQTEAVKLRRLVPYEFKATGSDGTLVGHAYFAPFRRSNHLVRFLGPSVNPLVSGITTDQLTKGPNFSDLVFRNAQGSFRHDLGQSLQINGEEALGDDTAGRTSTTVGLLVADQNNNGKTDLGADFKAPFVVGTDVYIDARKPKFIEVDWNGTTMRIPNWPSDQGLISIVVP